MTSYVRAPFTLNAFQKPTVGDQKMSFTDQDHMGWLLCNGRSLLRSEYPLLFGVIGIQYGAADSTHFNLPNASGTVIGAAGQPSFSNSVNTVSYDVGDSTGEQVHILSIAEMPRHTHGPIATVGGADGTGVTSTNGDHNHGITDPGHDHSTQRGDAGSTSDVYGQGTGLDTFDGTTGSRTTGITINNAGNHTHSIGTTGNGQTHNNMQPTLFAGNYFIFSGYSMNRFFPYEYRNTTGGQVAIY